MKQSANKMNTLSRRGFMTNAAKVFFGVSVGGSLSSLYSGKASAAENIVHAPAGFGKAKSVIYLFMSGGMSHIDTFDPKPKAGVSTMGKTETIYGKGDISLGHHLKGIAQESDSIALIRSMTSTQGAHAQGKYFMRTGFMERASITHPAAGSWVNKLKPKSNETMPGYITVNCGNGHPGAGFLDPSLSPLPVGNAEKGLQNISKHSSVSDQEFQQQIDLRKQLDADFDSSYTSGYRNVRAYNDMYDAAVKLMKSADLEAFDLSKEDKEMHELYGNHKFAKGCLLARRLVERNVNFIEVELGGFDWHNNNFEEAEDKLPIMDKAVSALLADLKQRGLLDTTLVVVATEFGRSPKINPNKGRNHYPKAFSSLIAGAGIKGGTTYGKTDDKAGSVLEGKVTAGDLNSTIAHAMGIPFDKTIYSPSRRPFTMGTKEGKPIFDLFA